VRDFILELKKERKTIFLNTHNLDEAQKICDRIGVLKTRLLAVDATETLLESFWGRQTVIQLRQVNDAIVAAVKKLGLSKVRADGNKLVIGVDSSAEENPRIVDAVVAAGGRIEFVTELLPTLEDVYLRLVRS
jgi:ABC-2 type transport system ATP-binding protein